MPQKTQSNSRLSETAPTVSDWTASGSRARQVGAVVGKFGPRRIFFILIGVLALIAIASSLDPLAQSLFVDDLGAAHSEFHTAVVEVESALAEPIDGSMDTLESTLVTIEATADRFCGRMLHVQWQAEDIVSGDAELDRLIQAWAAEQPCSAHDSELVQDGDGGWRVTNPHEPKGATYTLIENRFHALGVNGH